MTNPRSHVIEVGDLGFEGGEGCDLARLVGNLVQHNEPSQDMTVFNALASLKHLIIEINGSKRPEDGRKPEFQAVDLKPEEYGYLGKIAVKLGAPNELDEVLCNAFVKCLNCPNVIDFYSETFITIDGDERMTTDEWHQQKEKTASEN